MEEYSGYSGTTTRPQSTKWTDPTRVKLIQVHKVDRPNQGHTLTSPQSGRTPPRVKSSPRNGRTQSGSQTYKSTKWTDLTKGQTYTSPQSGRTPPRVKTSPQSGRTLPRVKLIQVHKVDGPHQGSKPINKVSGPNQGRKLI